FLREIRDIIQQTRDIPVLYNDTSLLSKREWRSRALPVVDGFMFEAAETPEEKLFNMQLGQSTGKVTWTYVGTHTQYNREHLKNERVRGWFSYPLESQELLLDGATALAAGVGLVYWGLSRFFFQPEQPLSRYPMLYVPNAACLSDSQCLMLVDYVRRGGMLLATHLTSVADEYGRVRKNYGLAEVFGADLIEPEPVEIPDLYLRLSSGE